MYGLLADRIVCWLAHLKSYLKLNNNTTTDVSDKNFFCGNLRIRNVKTNCSGNKLAVNGWEQTNVKVTLNLAYKIYNIFSLHRIIT